MKNMIAIIIGFLLSAIDINITTNFSYPDYQSANDLGMTFQKYVIDNIVGSKLQFDILPDVLGFVLILIGVIGLTKQNKALLRAYPFILILVVASIVSPLLPYYFNGKALCYSALILTFFIMLWEIFMEYFVILGLIGMTDKVQNRRNNVAVKVGWIISIACKVILFITGFIGIGYLVTFYGLIYIGSTLFYSYKLYQSRSYL